MVSKLLTKTGKLIMINLEDRTKLVENTLADHIASYNKQTGVQQDINKEVCNCLENSHKTLAGVVKNHGHHIKVLFWAVMLMFFLHVLQALQLLRGLGVL